LTTTSTSRARPATKDKDVSPEDKAQLDSLIDGAINVAVQLKAARGRSVTIHAPEAEYLQLIPHQLLHDITSLAIRRVQMRAGHSYLQRGDIDWAWTRLVVGKRSNGWLNVLNSVGGVLLGAGIPVLVGPILENQPLPTSGILLAVILVVPGLIALSVALSISVFRR
jgi:hypothetical protein